MQCHTGYYKIRKTARWGVFYMPRALIVDADGPKGEESCERCRKSRTLLAGDMCAACVRELAQTLRPGQPPIVPSDTTPEYDKEVARAERLRKKSISREEQLRIKSAKIKAANLRREEKLQAKIKAANLRREEKLQAKLQAKRAAHDQRRAARRAASELKHQLRYEARMRIFHQNQERRLDAERASGL